MRKNLLFFIIAMLFACPPAFADAEVGKKAPRFVIRTLDGDIFDLGSRFGRVVIINYWATWCPPCREEMPMLNAMFRNYGPKGVDMIGVSVDREVHRREVAEMMKKFTYPGAMLLDASADDFGWMAAVPVTYIIDRKGILRAKITPDQLPLNEKTFTSLLDPLLAN